MLKFLASLAYCRCVDDRHHLFDMVHYHSVEQRLVAILQCNQVQIAFKIGRLFADVAKNAQLLLGECGREAVASPLISKNRVRLRCMQCLCCVLDHGEFLHPDTIRVVIACSRAGSFDVGADMGKLRRLRRLYMSEFT